MNNLNIVLFEPEIPQNTGNIIRTCVALDMTLHLIFPIGFSLEEKYLKRAALDYFRKVRLETYDNIEEFFLKNSGGTYYYYSRYGLKDYTKAKYKVTNHKPIYLIFGKESTGIPKELLKENIKNVFRIPTTDSVRSINLSNCVSIVSFFASYKNNFKNLEYYEPETLKGKNFIKKISKKG